MRFSLYITQSVKSKLQKALCFRIGLFYMLLDFDLSEALLVFRANHEGEIQPFRNEGI